jgi:protein-disulfide isomerase
MRDYEAAKETGVGGTPTYMIGGELLGGDVSIDDLRAAIKSAAAG